MKLKAFIFGVISMVLHQVSIGQSLVLSVSLTPNPPSPMTLDCDCPDGYGSITASAVGGAAPYTYLWSTGEITASIQNLLPGTYTVTVTDAALTTVSDSYTFLSGPFWPNISYLAPTPGNCNGLLYFNPFCATTPIGNAGTYTWNDGYNYAQIVCNPGPAATHDVFTSPSSCPSALNGISVDPNQYYTGPCTVQNTGYQPQSCSNTKFTIVNQHNIDQSFPQQILLTEFYFGWPVAKLTDLNGNLLGNPVTNVNGYMQTQVTSEFDFGISYDGMVIFEYVEAVFDGDTMGVYLKDTFNLVLYDCGSVTGKVFLDMDHDCNYGSASDILVPNATLNIQPGNTNVITNDSGQFLAYLPFGSYTATQLNPYGFLQTCPATISFVLDSINSSVIIDVADSSLTTPVCDATVTANSTAARPGFEYSISLKVKNNNWLPTPSSTLTLAFDNLLQFDSVGNGGQVNGNIITWPVPILNAFETFNTFARFDVPVGTAFGTILTSNANVSSVPCDTNLSNNTYLIQRSVTGSFDPNDKSVSPIGAGPAHAVPPDHRLTYSIDFENTGTDTAFTVLLIDTLSQSFNLNSIRMEMSSHQSYMEVDSAGVLHVYFPNILLPDSNVNPSECKGYFVYSIEPLPGTPEGTIVENSAGIYFDFNIPVFTTTVFNTLKNGPVAVCQNAQLYLDSMGIATLLPEDVDGGSNDFFGISSMSVSNSSFTCADTGSQNVTLYVTNLNNEIDSCIATIQVSDTIPPQLQLNNINVYLDANGLVSISASQVNAGTTDNCAILAMIVLPFSFSCNSLGSNQVTFTAYDVNQNGTTGIAMVNVFDTIAPTALCHDTVLGIDSSSCTLTLLYSDINNSSSDNCLPLNYSLSQSTFNCSNIGQNVVELTVTDLAGNSSQCTAIVTIVDVTGLQQEGSTANHFNLVPNPSNGLLMIPDFAENGTLEITDVSGHLVYFNSNLEKTSIDLYHLSPACYLVTLTKNKKTYRAMWVKY